MNVGLGQVQYQPRRTVGWLTDALMRLVSLVSTFTGSPIGSPMAGNSIYERMEILWFDILATTQFAAIRSIYWRGRMQITCTTKLSAAVLSGGNLPLNPLAPNWMPMPSGRFANSALAVRRAKNLRNGLASVFKQSRLFVLAVIIRTSYKNREVR